MAVWRDCVVFRIPLRQRFRGVKFREGVVFRGTHGWGEFAPFLDHADEHAASWLKAAIEMAFAPAVHVAIDCVRSNAIVPECDEDEAVVWAKAGECETAKVKVSGEALNRRQDLDRLWSVSRALGVNAKLRVDLNGACTVAAARDFAQDCKGLPIEYLEQPCATLEECGELRGLIDFPVAVDESIRLPDSGDRSAYHRSIPANADSMQAKAARIRDNADIAVLKPLPLGGLSATQKWAERLQMPCVVSSSLDSSVGLSYIAKTAAVVAPESVHGLGTGALLAADLVKHTLVPHQGEVHVGLIEPDLVALERASEGTRGAIEDKWQMRMARCWQALANDSVLDLVPS